MKNKLNTIINLITCVALLGGSFSASTALAYAGDGTPKTQSSNVDAELWQLRHDRDTINRGGAIAGLALSGIGITAGSVMFAMGGVNQVASSIGNCFFSTDPNCANDSTSNAGRGLIIGGTALVALGTVGMVVSAVRLHHKKSQEKELDLRIRELEAQSDRVSIAQGAPQSPALVHF